MSYNISPSLSHSLHLAWQSLDHSCCCKWHYFILFDGWVISHCICVPHFIYSFLCQWVFGLFLPLAIVNNASTKISIQISESLFSSLGPIFKRKLLGHMVILFSFLRNHHTVHISCYTYHALKCFPLRSAIY